MGDTEKYLVPAIALITLFTTWRLVYAQYAPQRRFGTGHLIGILSGILCAVFALIIYEAIAHSLTPQEQHQNPVQIQTTAAVNLHLVASDTSTAPATSTPADPGQASDGQLSPGMLVAFPKSGIVCATKDALRQVVLLGTAGNSNALDKLMVSDRHPNAMCTMAQPEERFTVVSSKYDTDKLGAVGVMEITAEGNPAGNNAWALTVGAVRVD